MRQQNNERLRRAFAQKANTVGQWIERYLDLVANIGMQKGKLEDHLNKLKNIEKEVDRFMLIVNLLGNY